MAFEYLRKRYPVKARPLQATPDMNLNNMKVLMVGARPTPIEANISKGIAIRRTVNRPNLSESWPKIIAPIITPAIKVD